MLKWTCCEDLVDELFDTFAEHHDGMHISAITSHTLRHVDGGIALLGVGSGGKSVVCHDPTLATIYHIPVSPIGLHVCRAEVHSRHVPHPEPWVEAHRDGVVWTHPDYRSETGMTQVRGSRLARYSGDRD